jgi:hypothetical protein
MGALVLFSISDQHTVDRFTKAASYGITDISSSIDIS